MRRLANAGNGIGAAESCRRAEVTHLADRAPRQNHPISPSASFSVAPGPAKVEGESTINERILSLVTTLSERVQHLEAKIEGGLVRKRGLTDDSAEGQISVRSSPGGPLGRPFKQARLTPLGTPQSELRQGTDEFIRPENESGSVQNSSDAEVEDAATVLEFLAWGRLKESNLTTGVRDTVSHDLTTYPEKDVLQSAQAWASPASFPMAQQSMDPLSISQIQEGLPRKVSMKTIERYRAIFLGVREVES